MSPSESSIYFGCPRCTAPLKARLDHAGRRWRCPVCQWAVEVPRANRRTDFEEYIFHDDSGPAADAAPEIAFECPVCHTRMTAPRGQVGQQVACPDCRTPTTVPADLKPRRRTQPVPPEAYAVCEDFDPASPPVPHLHYLPLFCGRCGTLMQATVDQVGSEVTCPDCGMATVVQLPRLHGKSDACPTSESYEVNEQSGQPPPESVAYQEHVGFVCQCGSRLHALVAEVGQQLICPDCGRSVTVPPRRRKPPRPDATQEVDGQYDTVAGTSAEPRSPASLQPQRWFAGRFSRMLDEQGRLPPPPLPPRWSLVSGVFTFPWRHGAWAKWSSLSAGAMLIGGTGLFGWNLAQSCVLGGGPAAIVPSVFGMLLETLGGCLAVAWAGVFFINLLTILGDTAAGADDVGYWPNSSGFLDWAGSTFFVVNSLALSGSVGIGLGWLLQRAGLPGGYAAVGVPVVLFPLVLLSMLEANSPLVPWSASVCRSLGSRWRAWGGFYLETTLLLAVTGGMALAAILPGKLLLAVPVVALTMVASSMIYFRLLGRLAWCCAAG